MTTITAIRRTDNIVHARLAGAPLLGGWQPRTARITLSRRSGKPVRIAFVAWPHQRAFRLGRLAIRPTPPWVLRIVEEATRG